MSSAWAQYLIFLGTLLGAGYTSTTSSWWCYEDPRCGPETWRVLGHCNGTRQSPIDILTSLVVHDPQLGAVSLTGYEDPHKLKHIKNSGKTVDVELEDGLHLSGAGLPAIYTAKSFHLHWGDGAAKPGSEHLIDHQRFSMELHIVHTKNNMSVQDALKDPVGIAVLGFFVQAEEHAYLSPAWDSFTKQLKKVDLMNKSADLDGSFSLRDLLGTADLARYYRYSGSLTTPNCDEVVIWTVFRDPIPVPPGVVDLFPNTLSSTNSSAGPPLRNNYRPTQELGARHVYASAALLGAHSASPAPGTSAFIPMLISAVAIAWQL